MLYVTRGHGGHRADPTGQRPMGRRGRQRGLGTWRGIVLAVLMLAFAGAPAQAVDLEYDWEIADLLIVRPLGLVGLAMGSVYFIAAAPLTYIFANDEVFEDSLDRCILTPGEYVFTRPLGEF